jgi:hypothetical protein
VRRAATLYYGLMTSFQILTRTMSQFGPFVPRVCRTVLECATAPDKVVGTVDTSVKLVALILGGVWSYRTFVRQRQRYPRATVSHSIVDHEIRDGIVLLHVAVEVTNVGLTILRLREINTWIQRVRPISEQTLASLRQECPPDDPSAPRLASWAGIADRQSKWQPGVMEIEPGEADTIHFDFLLHDKFEVVQVYSHVRNQIKRGLRRDRHWYEWPRVWLTVTWLFISTFNRVRHRNLRRRLACLARRRRRRLRREIGWGVRSVYELGKDAKSPSSDQSGDCCSTSGPRADGWCLF